MGRGTLLPPRYTAEVKKNCESAEKSWNKYYDQDKNTTSINIKQRLVNGKQGMFSILYDLTDNSAW